MEARQKIVEISLDNLRLWTENPRDPVDLNSSNDQIINRALFTNEINWELGKLSKKMGDYYDFSELPIVVKFESENIVFDGNRRIALGMIKHGCVTLSKDINFEIPKFPKSIPCVICDEKTAIKSVYRKHGNSGSWSPLHKDSFLHYKMGQSKSDFLVIDEETNVITRYPLLNKRFVKEEIFTIENLKKIGFYIKKGSLYSNHSDKESFDIFREIVKKIEEKEITTRKNRGKIFETLSENFKDLIFKNKDNQKHKCNIIFDSKSPVPKKTPRARKVPPKIFGDILNLKLGNVNNLYLDITDLYKIYNKNKDLFSDGFQSIIRMSLRLICETAANEINKNLDSYLRDNFDEAKKDLTRNEKTTLESQGVNKSNLVKLIHLGTHDYDASKNMNQTIAISLVLGKMFKISHGNE